MIAENRKAILSVAQTSQKIRRIAFEMYERNFSENEIMLAGIAGEGYEMARQLATELRAISPFTVTLVKIDIDKLQPHAHLVRFDIEKTELAGKVVIVIDDVLNTGRTLAYSLSPLLGIKVKKVQVAVMINRAHHTFPIFADYVGYSISTTLNEHVEVVLTGQDAGVYLN